MPSLPLVVIAEARSLAWRCGIDEPSALSLTAQAWADFPDQMWRTVAHRRCVDERRHLSGRDGPDHRPVPILDEQAHDDGGSTVGELIPCEEHGYQEAESRCDLVALIVDLPDDELAALARHFWLGVTPSRNTPAAVCEARAMRHARVRAADPPERGPLTDRELEVLAASAEGLTNEAAARRLHVSPNTVKTHLSRIIRRLGARNTAHAVAIAFRGGWLT